MRLEVEADMYEDIFEWAGRSIGMIHFSISLQSALLGFEGSSGNIIQCVLYVLCGPYP